MPIQGDLFEELETETPSKSAKDLAPSREFWLSAPSMAFQQWALYVATMEKKYSYSDRSIRQFQAMFGAFCRYLAEHRSTVLSVGVDGLASFLMSVSGRDQGEPGLRKQEESPWLPAQRRTLKRYTNLINAVMDHLVMRGYRRENPVKDASDLIKGRNVSSRVVCMPAQLDGRLHEYLLGEMPTATWQDRRTRALLLLLSGAGLTASQAAHARLDQFLFNDVVPSFDCPAVRGADAYRVALSGFCVEPLREWVAERKRCVGPSRGDPTLAFPSRSGKPLGNVSVYNQVSEALREINFHGDDMGPRVLRTTYARRLLLSGATVSEVAGFLGLKTARSVEKLVRVTPTYTGFVPV
ncbi:tyrosine-type recombinase/integrase [Paraburkholderia sp. J8-2]|uniref:tyrosine-type recombinase/integrase n=1 Tax=Paraburkholderia sp. J8-2 TaxID=2805440 RepID=UPI002AB79687|nr:tyrosine-type recombinase/integrase [Paraburkholderia sp. J8-2]